MTRPKVTICTTCTGGSAYAAPLQQAVQDAGLDAEFSTTECMSGCKRPATLAVRQSGKMAYLFGEISQADQDDLITFLRLYTESADGTLADARPLGALRFKAIARIPA